MAQPAARPRAKDGWRAMLAKVHLAAKDLGLDEDTRRDVIERVTGGLRSAGACNQAQLHAVLAEFRRLGWKGPAARPKAAGGRTPATSSFARKARAMWISLHQLGVVRDPSERALEAFGARQLRVDRLQWADESQAHRLIEALKAMATRHGWDQQLDGIKPDRQVWTLKARLVNAQRERLGMGYLRNIAAYSEADLDEVAKGQAAQIYAQGRATF
jgi:phage gp16-like protein